MRTSKGEMKSSLKKGAWSAEEDRKLIAYINRYGIWNWSHMPKFAGLLRSGKSCRLRWMNYLKPDLKKGSFSEEEERSILHFHSILGNRWSAIARKLPGRSDNEIKNYWHTNLKKRAVANKQLMIKNSKQKSEINTAPCNFQSSDHNLQKITDQEDDLNHVNDITNFLFSWTPEDDITSITSINTSNGHEVDRFTGDHMIGSPGTVEDLQCFWRDLYPLDQDLELGNIDHDQEMSFLDDVLLDSYNDPIVPWGFYNNEYEIMSTSVV